MDDGRPEDMEHWLDAAVHRGFWNDLAPELPIEGPPAAPLLAVDDHRREELWNDLLTDGYFQLEPTLPTDRVAVMAQALLRLDEHDIPAVFAYVYDDFWNLTPQISSLLAAILGPDFRVQPSFWAWCIQPRRTEKGWHPHRDQTGFDNLLPNGLPRSLSIWVPLTDATPENGCMYVLPACRDPHYLARENSNAVVDVQEVRALPARAGSVLGWNQSVLHWGSRSSERAVVPRVSFSIEYQRADSPPLNAPLLDAAAPPTFEQRLGLIGKQILQYRHMYELGSDFEALAERLVERYRPQGA